MRMAMIAITTSNSISVNPVRRIGRERHQVLVKKRKKMEKGRE